MTEPEQTTAKQQSPLAFVGSVLKYSVSTWSGSLIALVALIVGTRILSDTEYGVYSLFLDTANTLMLIGALGLDHAYIRFYPEPPKGIPDRKNLAAVTLSSSMLSLIVFSAALFFLLPNALDGILSLGGSRLLLALLFVTAFFLLVTRFFNITYRMQDNIKMYTVQYVLQQFFLRLFGLFGLLVNPSADYLIYFTVFGLGGFAVAFFFIQRKSMLPKKVTVEKGAMKPLFRYGLGLTPGSIFSYGNTLFSKFYVSAALGVAAVGVYNAVAQMSMVLGILQAGFSVYWSAFIFKNHKEDQRRITRMHEYMMFGMMVLMALLIAAAPLLVLFLGADFRAGRSIFGLSLFAPMLLIVSETTVYGINISKKTYFDGIGMGISFALNALLCIFMVPRYGMAGAAAALAVSGAAMFLFRTVVAQKFYRTIANPAKTALSLLLMAALAVFAFLFDSRPLLVAVIGVALAGYYLFAYRVEFKRLLQLAGDFLKGFKKKEPTNE